MRTVALKRPELSAFDVEDAGPHLTIVFDCSAHPSDTNSYTLPDDLAAESRSADDLLTALVQRALPLFAYAPSAPDKIVGQPVRVETYLLGRSSASVVPAVKNLHRFKTRIKSQ